MRNPSRTGNCILAAMVAGVVAGAATAQSPVYQRPTLYDPQVDVRTGGVLEESFSYHQEGHERNSPRPGPYPPAGGWYGYGFPVTTYRWGWFGAERYYPRVTWHKGTDGDCMRWAYRYGY